MTAADHARRASALLEPQMGNAGARPHSADVTLATAHALTALALNVGEPVSILSPETIIVSGN